MDLGNYKAEDGGVLSAWMDIHKENCMYIQSYKKWYLWNGTHWEPDNKQKLQLSIFNVINKMNDLAREKLENAADEDEEKVWKSYIVATKCSDRRIGGVEKMAQAHLAVDVNELDRLEYLNLKNGTLNLVNFALMPHDRKDKLTYCMDYDYDITATSPNWDKAVARFDSTVIDFYQEFCGYSLTPDTQYEIAVWLKGERGGGKSTLIHGAQSILGSRSWVLSLSNLQKSRFALADLPGKTLIVATEQPNEYVQCSDTLNAIISGESILVDMKFAPAIVVMPICKILWAMNDYPTISNPGDGLYRRIKVVEVPKLNKAIVDPDLKKKIAAEKSGILNWAITGLQRLRARGKFNVPVSVEQATRDFELENDIVGMFIDEMCELASSYTVQSKSIYDAYKEWCKDNGYKSKSMVKFARDLRRVGFSKRKDSGGLMVWHGLKMIW